MPKNPLIQEYAKLNDIDEDLANEVIASFFSYIKDNIASGLPYHIRMKYLGTFKTAISRARVKVKQLESLSKTRQLSEKEINQLSSLKEYLNKYEPTKKTKRK